ncbi:hypothetical protein MGU_11313 [Metarhizium guizhouense ARSEF 977]|uniref:Uncharacterized protein n=1 Tax=Metarhizium guizhouense (strain ARSEF 977) TaxID=1276136 RepID=A0A0B4HPF6_METGA|nr:hypothetical protein MGU_11313 [Metarhizium guizhouense ARSEF 977]
MVTTVPSIPPSADTPSSATETINVLIVGETQQGKSTLIKQLAQYAGIPPLDVDIGDGNESCTKKVGVYEVSADLKQYQLVDQEGQAISHRSYSEYCDLTPRKAKVAPIPGLKDERIDFTLIDTPGLSDSSNADMDIMAGIIGRLAEIDHINAVIYVRGMDSPFGQFFKDFFSYFQRSLPSLSNGLMIVHSNFTTYKVEEFLQDDKNLAKIREEAFKAATNLELPHFFMDNDPDVRSPFAVKQSLNETYRLLAHIASQKPSPLNKLKLLKTRKMIDHDVHVVSALNDLKMNLSRSWNDQKNHAKLIDQIDLEVQRDLARDKRKLDAEEKDLKDFTEGPDVLLGTISAVEDYSFFSHLLLQQQVNLGRKVVTFDSDYKITNVEKSRSGGSQWLDEKLRGTSWEAIITSGWFRDIQGSATFYTTSKIRHADEIALLKRHIEDLKENVNRHNEKLGRSARASQDSIVALGEQIEALDALIQTVNSEILDISLWPKLKVFYSLEGRPMKHDIRGFVTVYNSELGKLVLV